MCELIRQFIASAAKAALVATFALVTSSCVTRDTPSLTGEIAASDLDYFWRSLKTPRLHRMFDPTSVTDGGVSNASLKSGDVEFLSQWLSQFHSLHRDDANKEISLRPLGIHKVSIVDTGLPVAEATGSGIITIDKMVIRAIFRASLREYFPDERDFAPIADMALARDTKLFGGFPPGGISIGSAAFEDHRRWPPFVRLMAVENLTARSLEFLLLHEVGHVRLQHATILKQTEPRQRCAKMQLLEAEADEFAALYVALSPGIPEGIHGSSGITSALFGSSKGRRVALIDADELHARGLGANGCHYPAPKSRIQAIENVLDQTKDNVLAMSPRVRNWLCWKNDSLLCSPVEERKNRIYETIRKPQNEILREIQDRMRSIPR